MSSKGTDCCVAVIAVAIPRRWLGNPRSKRWDDFAGFSRQTVRGSRKSMTGCIAKNTINHVFFQKYWETKNTLRGVKDTLKILKELLR